MLTIAQDIAFLFDTGDTETGKLVLGKALRGRSNPGLTDMTAAPRQQARPELLAAAAQWVMANFARIGK